METINEYIDDSGILLIKNAMDAGFTKYALYNYIRDYDFVKVAHGIYALPDTLVDKDYILSLKCPNGVLSHDTSLFYHDLTDREPIRQTITIYSGYGTMRLADKNVKVFTVKKELLGLGKTIINNNYGHPIPIYDKERTICDLFRSRQWFEKSEFSSSLKAYLRRSDKDLHKLIHYAEQFNVDKKIKEYLEVLL